MRIVGGTERSALSRVAVSIVIPTYREAENLTRLIPRIAQAIQAGGWSYEILVVDDASPDPTAEVCEQLRQRFPLELLTRHHERGLSSAVIHGCDLARGRFLVVMDADLSHPPESIPFMIDALEQGPTEFVLGSRYVAGGSTDATWSWARQWNSRLATWLARPLTRLADPMAGFFALPRHLYLQARTELNPIGYKIALEILVKADPNEPTEIPIHFTDRQHGESKLNFRQQLLYVHHLLRLYQFRVQHWFSTPARPAVPHPNLTSADAPRPAESRPATLPLRPSGHTSEQNRRRAA